MDASSNVSSLTRDGLETPNAPFVSLSNAPRAGKQNISELYGEVDASDVKNRYRMFICRGAQSIVVPFRGAVFVPGGLLVCLGAAGISIFAMQEGFGLVRLDAAPKHPRRETRIPPASVYGVHSACFPNELLPINLKTCISHFFFAVKFGPDSFRARPLVPPNYFVGTRSDLTPFFPLAPLLSPLP